MTRCFRAAGDRGLRLELFDGERPLRFEDEPIGNLLFGRRSPRQPIAGGNRMEARVRRVPIDLHAQPRRVIRRVLCYDTDHEGVDLECFRQHATTVRIVQISRRDPHVLESRANDVGRDDLEARDGL